MNTHVRYGWADRVITIEMFEHMKNYQLLLQKVSNWIKPSGKVSKRAKLQAPVPRA